MPSELLTIIMVSVVGGAVLFILQLLAYSNGIPPFVLLDVKAKALSAWSETYMRGSIIVIGVAVLSAFAWYFYVKNAKGLDRMEDIPKFAPRWWFFFLIPNIPTMAIALAFFRGNSIDALKTLPLVYLVDIFWCFWISTALSTPGLLRNSVPLSSLRRLLGI